MLGAPTQRAQPQRRTTQTRPTVYGAAETMWQKLQGDRTVQRETRFLEEGGKHAPANYGKTLGRNWVTKVYSQCRSKNKKRGHDFSVEAVISERDRENKDLRAGGEAA